MFMRLVLAASACLALQPAQALDWLPGGPAELDAVEAMFGDELAEAAAAGAETALLVSYPDLDDDGLPDLVAWIQNGYLCSGAGGCPAAIFLNQLGAYQYVGFLTADLIDVSEDMTNGMHDLEAITMAGMTVYRWDGVGYNP